jgi:hypothetical protein
LIAAGGLLRRSLLSGMAAGLAATAQEKMSQGDAEYQDQPKKTG